MENLLKGIHGQNHRDWEIVLVDSGSTDGTVEIARKYGARVFHIPKEEFTFGGSLNRGCQEALGRYLVFVSGHVWPITNTWLANLLKPFAEPEVAMVYGRQRGTSATNPCEARDFLMQFGVTSQILVDEPKGHNGNAAIRRDLWAEQPFDESLPAQEDVDWARKIQNKHYRVFYAADAAVYHAHDESLKQVYRRHRNEAVATKRMFPHNRLTWPGIVRRLPYFIGLDILFALRGRQYRKLFRVPLLRAVQVLGLYRGLRYQSKLASDTVRLHATPETSGVGTRHALGPPRTSRGDAPHLMHSEEEDEFVKVTTKSSKCQIRVRSWLDDRPRCEPSASVERGIILSPDRLQDDGAVPSHDVHNGEINDPSAVVPLDTDDHPNLDPFLFLVRDTPQLCVPLH